MANEEFSQAHAIKSTDMFVNNKNNEITVRIKFIFWLNTDANCLIRIEDNGKRQLNST